MEKQKSIGLPLFAQAAIGNGSNLETIFNLNKDPNELVLSKRKHFKVIFEGDSSFQMIDGAMNLIENYFNNDLTLILASSASMTNINRIFIHFIKKRNEESQQNVSCGLR